MKYSSTVRLINTILFALLGVGFGFLGVYFGILVAPYLWLGRLPFSMSVPNISLGLAVLLGALGIAGLIVSLFGFVKSILSLVRKDDEIVRDCFGCYIGIGYIAAVFFLLNAVWLYRVFTSNIGFDDIGFAIVIYVILMILALIASSIPLVKMFGEGEGTNRVMAIITRALVAIDLGIFLPFGIGYIAVKTAEPFSHQPTMAIKFGIYALIPLVAAIVGCLAYFGYRKAQKAGKYIKRNGLIFESALCVNGAAIIVAGILNYIYRDQPTSIMAPAVQSQWSTYMNEFSVCSYIVGGAIVLLSLILIYFTIFPPKLKNGAEAR